MTFMTNAAKSVILALIATPLQSTAFHPLYQRHTWSLSRVKTFPDGDDNGEMFNDFEDIFIGEQQDDSLLPSETKSLQTRLDILVNQEHEDEVRIAGNWKNGRWSVRGCSLDPGNEDERIFVSSLCPIDDDPNTVLVGRTDGSICWLKLGNEYIARFVTKLSAIEGKNETIRVSGQLRREDTQNEISSDSSQASNQFEVVGQVMAHGGGISQMLIQDELLLCATYSGTLEYWILSGDEPMSQESKILCQAPSSVVSICVQAVNGKRVLVCTCEDGDVLTWDIEAQFAPLQSRKLSAVVTPGDTILSFYSDETYSYFGTSQGRLLVYNTRDILASTFDINAIKRFSPFSGGSAGVSAIVSSQQSGFASESQASMTLVLGSTNGKIKQYAMMPQKIGLEHWPRLESQSIPGKCHLFESPSEERVRALRFIPGAILAASSNQLTLWDPENGKALFEMLGLDFESTEASLVLLDSNSVLITNGMKHLVCLHDFSEQELDLDENFEVI
ncbi:unnamed protein product [Cylindrotheca closterium]|uniref:Uncharacterized protein n=1 Tax=Cylindrotheca closterium TaxID=2856 RepID=A0AAD2FFH5_9STRA|nr:unnamed protein product [Cylindrotheca closterium]